MYPTEQQQRWMYSVMAQSRYFEEQMAAIYLEGKKPVFDLSKGPIPGEMHLSDGQEPCAVGVCAHLETEDALTAGHRPHHFAIAKGIDLNGMTAEIFGKKAGLSGGRGGHMHLFDRQVNFGCAGIVGQGLSMAAGAALAFKLRGRRNVAVAVIGEGAANCGLFHEVLNLAALWKLPFICVIEDNGWAVTVSKQSSTAVRENAARAAAYGMPGHTVRDNDPFEIFRVMADAIARARSGGGPSLVEIETMRLAGHFQGDPDAYRSEAERKAMRARDPLPLMRARLLERGVPEGELEAIEDRARASVDEAICFARAAPLPSGAEALEHVFA
jgi:pyruvate dehydrogenase E1 component alpha subunit